MAKQLYIDKMELPLTVHNEDFEEVQKMALVSNSLLAKFFEIYPGDEDNADAWTASADAFDLRHDLQSKKDSKKRQKGDMLRGW